MILIAKQYYLDPWQQKLNTKVLSASKKDGLSRVILEDTIFYPTGGGQPHDLGSINDVLLLDVFEESGDIIHVLEQPLETDKASCKLDWARRFDHMQQHSGQHLLSAILCDDYNYQTESFHLGEDYCSIDISTPSLSKKEQNKVEAKVNEIILSNLPITTYTLGAEELHTRPLRKIPDLAGDLRIVEIQGLDHSPCSGTHVDRTGQIGLLKIIKSEKYKGMTRVYFLCGKRAFVDYANKQETCQKLSSLLSIPEGELFERTTLELKRRQELERDLSGLKNELWDLKAQNIVSQGNSPFFLELLGGTIEEAQQLARCILSLAPAIVIINLGERIVLMQVQDDQLHLGQLIKEHAQPLGGKGGGSATSAQVYFAEPTALDKFLDLLKLRLLR